MIGTSVGGYKELMGKVAFVFPGQGSQYVGMGYDFYKEFAEAADVFSQCRNCPKVQP